MPELVIADQPFKKYPGDVLALRAVDWMGAARGSLSTDTDARACTGTVVRETQKIASSNIYLDPILSGVQDTLTIDLSTLPVRTGVRHLLGFSFLIEGDHNPTDSNSNEGTESANHFRAARLSFFGDSTFWTESNPTEIVDLPRKMGMFTTAFGNGILGNIDGTEVIHVRAFGMDGTTIEWLIDQVYLIPYTTSGFGSWNFQDFKLVDGAMADFSEAVGLDEFVDGADGGDANGKFTVHPYNITHDGILTWVSEVGGGDYQQKSGAGSAEYFAEVRAGGDFYDLYDSRKDFPNDEPRASHAYGLHGSYLEAPQVVTSDPFSRTVGDGNFSGADGHFQTQECWNETPEGFTWRAGPNAPFQGPFGPYTDTEFTGERHGRAAYVEGGRGVLHIRRKASVTLDSSQLSVTLGPGGTTTPTGRPLSGYINMDDLSFSGKLRVDIQNPYVSAAGDDGNILIRLVGQGQFSYYVWLNVVARTWSLWDNEELLDGPNDIISWWTGSTELGWRFEIQRYRLRFRVWDASGAEPSTWDYNEFRKLFNAGGIDYPYSDDLSGVAWEAHDLHYPQLMITPGVFVDSPGNLEIEELKVSFDDITVENNPWDNADDQTPAHFQMERPKGTSVGNIATPVGAMYLVFWGTRDWTDVAFDTPSIEFAMKAWNEPGAPSMQRAETPFWYFASQHGRRPRIIRYR